MSATKCLKCDEPVLIPSGASLKATVRCPLCHEEFVLGEMLDEVPPPLEIVEDPDAVAIADVQHFSFDPEDKKDRESADTDADEEAGDKAEGDESDDTAETSAPAFQFDAASQGSSTTATKSYRPSARPKRKAKNPAIEMGKIVGGGVMGIALALVAIWWGPKIFGKPPKDILDLGPKVSKIAPWIVPSELHASPANETKDGESAEDNKKSENNKPRPDEGTALPKSDKQNGQIGSKNLTSKFGTDGTARANGNGETPKPKKGNPIDDDDRPVTKPIDRSAAEFLGIRNAKTVNPSEFEKAITAATVALTIWNSDLESERYQTRAMEDLARLGKSIACVNQTLDANKTLLSKTEDDVLKDIAQSEAKREAVNQWAVKQLQGGADLRGVVLAAEVKSIELVDRLFENRLELLTDGKEQISMLTARDISDVAPPGAKVIVVGAIVSDPSTNFGGYGGNDDKVLGCGTLFVLEPASN